jgi:Ni2+-binding GTPase involved in maturation of urease and hydrogenase
MKRLRFVMVGGFLGAGKTTTLARLAKHYRDRGQSVGLVTNDQAENLVDTENLRGRGLPVVEVAGACFCCRFDELVDKVGELQQAERPDVILAEPVGSCTDLVATVVQPLKALYGDRFDVAPYAVLFKPSHGLRILRGEGSGFSPKAAYIFHKQLEEADAVVINRIDELPPAELDELTRLVNDRFPGTPVLRVSAKTGTNFETLTSLLDRDGAYGRKILDIDYDTYAEGEAELGWHNSTAGLTAAAPFALDALVVDVVSRLRTALASAGGEVAHLKVIGLGGGSFAVANLVSSSTGAELSVPSKASTAEAELTVNARVAIDPAVLDRAVKAALDAASAVVGATAEERSRRSLRPGRPTPTHRFPAPA